MQPKTSHGIRVRHSRSCPYETLRGPDGKKLSDSDTCTAGRKGGCVPYFEASVWHRRTNKKIRKNFQTLTEAKAWRIDSLGAKQRGTLTAPSKRTLQEAWESWYDGATAAPPTILVRGGRAAFKPSVVRTYRWGMDRYVLPDLGGYRLTELRRGHLQDLAERLIGEGLKPSTIRNIIMPVRAVYRREIGRSENLANPTSGLELPTGTGRRERAADIDEAELLISVLPEGDQPIWATAFYAGLRRGELQALRWSDIDLAKGVIRVTRAWDPGSGYVEPKSRKGTRTVPISGALREHLLAHKIRSGGDGDQLAFGSKNGTPFTGTNIRLRALRAWERENVKRAEQGIAPLQPIGLHELRHSCVSVMHAAGLSLEAIGDYVGHSSTYMVDHYRHLLEGHEADAVAMLDAFARLSSTSRRIASLADAEA